MAEAYSVGQVMAQAVTATGGTDNAKIISYLHSGVTLTSVQGPVKFDALGENGAAAAFIFQWQKNNFTQVLPAGARGGKPDHRHQAGLDRLTRPTRTSEDHVRSLETQELRTLDRYYIEPPIRVRQPISCRRRENAGRGRPGRAGPSVRRLETARNQRGHEQWETRGCGRQLRSAYDKHAKKSTVSIPRVRGR